MNKLRSKVLAICLAASLFIGGAVNTATIAAMDFESPPDGESKINIGKVNDKNVINNNDEKELEGETQNHEKPEKPEEPGGGTDEAHRHVSGDPVIENKVPATCTTPGSYENVYYCTRVINGKYCGKLMKKEKIIIDALGHTPTEAVENRVEPTCIKDGSYEKVVYCDVCGEELSRTHEIIAAPGHIECDPVIENEVKPTAEEPGYYDIVVYCERCNKELSREAVKTDALGNEVIEEEVKSDENKNESTAVSEKPAEIQEISTVKVEEPEEISNTKPTGEELIYENLAVLAMIVSSFGAIFIAVRHMNKRKEN